MTRPMIDPRDTGRWKGIRKRMVAAATSCAICGYALDHRGPARSRWRPSVDHILPIAHGGEPYAASNLRVVHHGCNSRAGAQVRRPRPPPLHANPSRVW